MSRRPTNDPRIEANHRLWNEHARLHPNTPMYRAYFDDVRAGKSCLTAIERRELGDVTGLRVLHLQCHLGQESLALCNLGASEVVGVDFSGDAVAFARSAAAELALPARFVESNVLEATHHADLLADAGRFDLVFASHGVFLWIDNLPRWYAVAAHFLAPGGRLYVVDGHPMTNVFDSDLDPSEHGFRVIRDYFASAPERFDGTGSYADPDAPTEHNVSYEWAHRIEDHINAAISAGLQITSFREHREAAWSAFPGAVQTEAHTYRLGAELDGRLPLTFSLAATQPTR